MRKEIAEKMVMAKKRIALLMLQAKKNPAKRVELINFIVKNPAYFSGD